jgi:hypothetical protein
MSLTKETYLEICESTRESGEPCKETQILNILFRNDRMDYPKTSEGEATVEISHSHYYPDNGLDIEISASMISHLTDNITTACAENFFFNQWYDHWEKEREEADDPSWDISVDKFWQWIAGLNQDEWKEEFKKINTAILQTEGILFLMNPDDSTLDAPEFGKEEIGSDDGTFYSIGGSYDSFLDHSAYVLSMYLGTDMYVVIENNNSFGVFLLTGDCLPYPQPRGCLHGYFPAMDYMPIGLLSELEQADKNIGKLHKRYSGGEMSDWGLVDFMQTGTDRGDNCYWDADGDGYFAEDEKLGLLIQDLPIIEIPDFEDWLEDEEKEETEWVDGITLSIIEFYKAAAAKKETDSFLPPIVWDPNCSAYFLGGRKIQADNTTTLPETPYWKVAPAPGSPVYYGALGLGGRQLELFPELQVGNRFLNLCKGEMTC